MNNVSLIGRIGENLELKKTPNDISVCEFNLAVKQKDKTVWIKIVAWRKNAELICKYLKKGDLLGINGSIDSRTYEKNGETRKTFEIVADKIHFINNKNKQDNAKIIDDEDEFKDLPF